jgi:branched-chain amino acid transport system substrate-binding protein
VATGLAGCTAGTGGGGGPVKFGLGVPTSGPFGGIGEDLIEGSEAAIAEVDGELNGRSIETITEDTESDPTTGRNKFEKLATRDEVDFIVGPVSASVGNNVIDVIDDNDVLTNYPVASRPPDEAGCIRPLFQTAPTREQQVITLANWTANELDGDVVMFSADFSGGQLHNQHFQFHHEQAGGTVVDEIFAPLSTQDFAPYFSQIESANADIVFSFFAGGSAIRYLKQAHQFGLSDVVTRTGLGYLTTLDILPAIGSEAAEGWITNLDFAETLERDAFTQFTSLMSDNDVSSPNLYHARGYTATKVFLEVAADVGSTAVDDVVPEMEGYEIAAPHGDIRYRESDHQSVLDFYIREVRSGRNEVIASSEDVVPESACDI